MPKNCAACGRQLNDEIGVPLCDHHREIHSTATTNLRHRIMGAPFICHRFFIQDCSNCPITQCGDNTTDQYLLQYLKIRHDKSKKAYLDFNVPMVSRPTRTCIVCGAESHHGETYCPEKHTMHDVAAALVRMIEEGR